MEDPSTAESSPVSSLPLAEEEVEDDEHDSKERVLQRYFLQEWKSVESILDEIVASQRVTDPSSVHKIRSIMDKYQEQGQLVEPYLESMVSPLMAIIRSRATELGALSDEILEVIQPLCIIIYSLVTVCGYKSVIKFFPHQVSDLELAISLLEKCHKTNSSTSLRQESSGEMEANCVLLLWLSILVLIPFDLSSVDTSMAGTNFVEGDGPPPLVVKILDFCKDYLSSAGPTRMISGLLLSRLLTRRDMSKAFTSFIDWANQTLSSAEVDAQDHFRLLGVVEALAAIFKIGRTQTLMTVVPVLWNNTSDLMNSKFASRSSLLRKYLVKLTQRIGLTRLPYRSMTWHYVGKKSTLGDNISGDINQSNQMINMNSFIASEDTSCEQEDDMDVPEMIEDVIGRLLSGLRDTDTIVRWSAAKGIGRICSRLTRYLSDEVLSSVLELFSIGEGDGSWHGGCLALAELARRGLLLPASFPKVVPVIIKALHYDVRRGPHSVGSHVRDAAAYVCWAFGRAYYHRDMKNILEQLSPHLLTVACYDREVNCRRAAAAAFQENVGRQGNFPHGIDIINTADYFALSSRTNSYLHVAVSIAEYDGYLHSFVDELIYSKICHWDKGLRELAAIALSSLVKFDVDYFANSVLEKLVPCTLSSDLCMRHGALLATGEVVLALHEQRYILSTDKQKMAANIVPAIEKARLYRGKGGEIMRSAVSRFIECISIAQIKLNEKTKRSLLDTLTENLKHPNPQIQGAAVKALQHYINTYLTSMENKLASDVIFRHLEQLTDPNVAARRGSALALGVLPFEFLATKWKSVLEKLCHSCEIEDNPEDRDAEARVNAVKGLVSVCETLAQPRETSDSFSEEDKVALGHFINNEVMSSLFKALDDYSTDNRGDVGSWVREAAMDGLERCTYILCKYDSSDKKVSTSENNENGSSYEDQILPSFNADLANKLIGGIIKQAVEKIDKIREAAAKILQRILHNKALFVPHIPHRDVLEQLVPDKTGLKWGVPSVSFPRFIQLLHLSCYSKHVMSGLVISVGGLQDSLKKASLSALLDYIHSSVAEGHESRLFTFSEDLLWVLQKYRKCNRVITPALKTIEILFSQKLLLNVEALAPIFCSGILDSLATELRGTKDFPKLYSGIAVLGYIASKSDPINVRAFSHLLTFLVHRYPKIRKCAAEQVYLVLLENGNLIAEDKLDEATEIITETCWEGDIEEAKLKMVQLCNIANIQPEQIGDNAPSRGQMMSNRSGVSDENASYSSLVGSAGF